MNSDDMLTGVFNAFATGMWEAGPLVIAVLGGLFFASKQRSGWRFDSACEWSRANCGGGMTL